ncbi:MAG TPA: DoxX family protein, partial [Algoriphagus sp.]|nr:DoxX family protein [Algoriphagus sp.]
KIIGAIVLVIPTLPLVVRQFAYFGFALTFLSAILAHISVNDPVSVTVGPILFLGILAVSYVYSIRVGYELAK